jgi:hypothetical protein
MTSKPMWFVTTNIDRTLRHKANQNGFCQMFNGGETDLRAITSNNIYETVGKYQESGTAVLSYGNLLQ